MESNSLQSSIMRRVYYSYFLSIFTHVMFWQGVFLSVATLLLARWLHVASIVNNFLSVPVGQAPKYIYNSFFGAIDHGELLTVVTLVAAAVVAVSAGYRFMQAVAPRLWMLSRI